jgi:hypothetical protein
MDKHERHIIFLALHEFAQGLMGQNVELKSWKTKQILDWGEEIDKFLPLKEECK